MPEAPPRPCSFPGCGELVTGHVSQCAVHRAMQDRTAGSARARYGRGWQDLARAWLKRHPFCVFCGAPASQVDHISGDKKDRRPSNLRSLCSPCHHRRSWRDHQVGGAAARRHYDRQ